MDKKEFIHLLEKYLTGKASSRESELLERYYGSFQKEPDRRLDETIEQRLRHRLQNHVKRDFVKQKWWISGVAASLLIILSVAFWFLKDTDGPQGTDTWAMVSTGRAQQKTITLPDGTLIRMNAESVLSYPSDFNKSERVIKVEGEVFLEVAHDRSKPFNVLTDHMVIEVLGTKFNVRAYKDEEYSETTLVEGAISVEVPATNQKLELLPSQKLTVTAEGKLVENGGKALIDQEKNDRMQAGTIIVRSEGTDTFQETSWTQQIISFEKDSFASIAKVLARWYDVDLVFVDEEITQWRFTATLKAKDGLQKVLEALQNTREFDFRKEGNKIFIIK